MEDASKAIQVSRETGQVFESVDRLADAIRQLSSKHNVLTPGGAMGGALPVLHSAGIGFVFVDPTSETYRLPGRSEVGIGKNALDRIAAAAGVQWDPRLCGRTDDGTDPHLVEFHAVGTLKQLDGTERMISAQKRIDLRASRDVPEEKWGSDAQEIARVAGMAKGRDGGQAPRDPWPQILQQRSHILSLAESKAKNRAIRSLGIRTAYTPADLAKGFAVVRLQFTGRHHDPEVEKAVAMLVAEKAIGSSRMLYGGEAPRALPARRGPIPRVVSTDPEPEDEPETPHDPQTGEVQDAEYEEHTDAPPPRDEPTEDPELICGAKPADGPYPRKPCSQFTVAELERKVEYAEKHRAEWNPKYVSKNESELRAIRAWLDYRRAASADAGAF